MSSCYICKKEEVEHSQKILQECWECGKIICPTCKKNGLCLGCDFLKNGLFQESITGVKSVEEIRHPKVKLIFIIGLILGFFAGSIFIILLSFKD